jgi:hypothetical protein
MSVEIQVTEDQIGRSEEETKLFSKYDEEDGGERIKKYREKKM